MHSPGGGLDQRSSNGLLSSLSSYAGRDGAAIGDTVVPGRILGTQRNQDHFRGSDRLWPASSRLRVGIVSRSSGKSHQRSPTFRESDRTRPVVDEGRDGYF